MNTSYHRVITDAEARMVWRRVGAFVARYRTYFYFSIAVISMATMLLAMSSDLNVSRFVMSTLLFVFVASFSAASWSALLPKDDSLRPLNSSELQELQAWILKDPQVFELVRNATAAGHTLRYRDYWFALCRTQMREDAEEEAQRAAERQRELIERQRLIAELRSSTQQEDAQ